VNKSTCPKKNRKQSVIGFTRQNERINVSRILEGNRGKVEGNILVGCRNRRKRDKNRRP
jgi:hypothetical protein